MKVMRGVFGLNSTRAELWVAVVLAGIFFGGHPGGLPSVAGATMDACPPPAGTVDSSFYRVPNPSSFEGAATVVQELPNGKILLGMFGIFSTGGTQPVQREILVRLNQDGTLDPEFVFISTNFYRVWQTHALAVARNGLLAVATSGYGTEGFWAGHFHLLRSDGSVIIAAQTAVDGSSLVRALAWQADGRLLIGGNFGAFLPGLSGSLGRLLVETGAVDTSFAPPTGLGTVLGLAVDDSGRILVFNGTSLLRLLPNGGSDPTFQSASFSPFFNIGDTEPPAPILLDSQGRILVGGVFTTVNGVPRHRVARLLPNGALDATFDPGSGPAEGWSDRVSLALQPDGKVLVGGHFTSFASVARRGIARLHGNGSVDFSFDAGTLLEFGGTVSLLRDGRALVTDYKPSYGGSMSPYRLLADPQPRLAPPEPLSSWRVRLRLDSVPGADYVLQASTNLTSWRDVGTNRASTCALEFTNAPPPGVAHFFRIRRPSEMDLGR